MTKVLFVGDVIGKIGRTFLLSRVGDLKEKHGIDFSIVNVENAAAGFGVTGAIADQLLEAGIDVLTSGNHIWYRKEILDYIPTQPRLLRPANYPASAPGRGSGVFSAGPDLSIGVINLNGRVFMSPLACPFETAEREIDALREITPLIIVDFHAEATSEKIALARHLDGKVSAVIGTHTHVQTADEAVLPRGTAFITDAGMTGAAESVIGMQPEVSIQRFISQIPYHFEPAKGPAVLNGVVVTLEEPTGKASNITRIGLKE
jgi:metallophosphoesterase (TIGR00282 family)